MRVFVTGGTGYVGHAIVSSLLAHGHDPVVLQRPNTTRQTLLPVQLVTGTIFDDTVLAAGMEGCDAVIHLVGIIREVPRKGVTMQRIHVEGTRSVLRAAQTAGVQRILHMSALGAKSGATASYHRSKWDAEQLVRQSPLNYTIIRPSVIYGAGGPGPEFLGQLTQLVHSAPVIPVIGHGEFRLQPVPLNVVGEAFVQALDSPATFGKVYELGGDDLITYKNLLRQLAKREGRPFRAVKVPVSVMKVMVAMMGRFAWFPITADQLTMLLEENICRSGPRIQDDLQLPQSPFTLL